MSQLPVGVGVGGYRNKALIHVFFYQRREVLLTLPAGLPQGVAYIKISFSNISASSITLIPL